MYVKLILRNAKRSMRDYLIYIVTLTLCIAMFYSFLSISSSYYNPDIGVQYDISRLGDGMKLAICCVTLLLLFLIKYVNDYMICHKQKEFAIQTVMGMEQRTTARLFFGETLMMACVSLIIGIGVGAMLSQLITAMLLSSYGEPFQITWTLYPDTSLLTVCFFLISFTVIGLFNIRTIRKTKVIDMLQADKMNEQDFKTSKWMPLVIAIFSLFLVWMSVVGMTKKFYYFDPRLPFPVHIMFWGNILAPLLALIVVILCFISWLLKRKWNFSKVVLMLLILDLPILSFAASVPVMKQKYYLALGNGTLNNYLLFILVGIIFAICAIFYLASDMITGIKEKFLGCRYHAENLFFFGQIISKLKTTTKTMTLICLTLVLSISLFLMTPVLIGWSSGYLDDRIVYDVQIGSTYNLVYDVKDLPDTDYDFVSDYLNEEGVQIVGDRAFSMYLPLKDDFHNRYKYDFPVLAISLSDYNHLRSMKGLGTITLKDDEFTTQWQSIATTDEMNEFIETHSSVDTDVGTLSLATEGIHHASLGEYIYNLYTDVVYVFPDEVCEELLSVERHRYIQTTQLIPFEIANGLEKVFDNVLPDQEGGVDYYLNARTLEINSITATNFILKAGMTYGAVVLLIICFTILALQQLRDATHFRYRFGVLRKMGVEEKRINKLILKQLGIWFGLPIGVAIVFSIIFAIYFFNMISAEISAYIGVETLLIQIATIVAILLVLLFCYFISTWILFKRTISE